MQTLNKNTTSRDPEDETGNSAFRFIWQSVKDHPVKTSLIAIGELVQAVSVLLLPFVTKDLVNAVIEYDPAVASQDIWNVVGGPFFNFIIVNVVLLVFARMSGMTLMFLAPVIRIKPRKRMTGQLQRHAMSFFHSGHSGALGTKINTATVSMGHSLWMFLFDIWPVIIKFIASCVLMLTSHIVLGLALLVWSVIYFAVILYLALIKSKLSEQISHERAKITGSIVDIATNIHAVKSFANENFEDQKLDDEMAGEIKGIYRFNIIRELSGWFHSLMTLVAFLGLMYLCVEYYAAGLITVGDIAFIFTLILILTEQAAHLGFSITHLLELYGQTADGVKTLFKPVTLTDSNEAKDLAVTKGHMEFRSVHFQYEDDFGKYVFEDMSLDIPPGQKVGFIGPSGAGKTTLVNLLLRFYDIQGGKILIDGQDISKVSQHSLRRNISVIPQDTTLFHRTLMENIRYGNLEASDEDVIEASKKAFAHDFIKDLPQGYDTLVGERGVKLSGGQRQRIAIARAILKNSQILILDEATSALDSESEKYIQDSLQELMEGKTVIAIAHRLSTIAHLDRLVVMDQGKIIEDGAHDDLIARNGLYSRLWTMQSGGFLGE